MSQHAVIVDAVRTPIGRRGGALAGVHPTELGARVLTEITRRSGIEPAQVDDVIMGCVSVAGEQALNIGRNAALLAGFPVDVPATTVDRQCGSSQQAVHFAVSAVEAGASDIVIAAGVESMTRVPMGSTRANGPGHPYTDALKARYPITSMGEAAEMIASEWRLERDVLDEFSLRSHRLAAQAAAEGRFDRELVPVLADGPGSPVLLAADEGVRRDTSLEKLAALKPAFRADGTVTAGNSSQISDGAAAVLVMSEDRARRLHLRPRARIAAQAVTGADPVLALTAPAPVTRKVLERARMSLDDMDLIEINEAFASVVLAWAHDVRPDMDRVNPNGGAIALGHPLGASGARIMTTLLHEMERRGARWGLQTMCIHGGLGIASILERL